MNPEAILKPLLGRIPDTLLRFLYLFLLTASYPENVYARAFERIFRHFPRARDLDDRSFHTSVRQLACLRDEDIIFINSLYLPTFEHSQSELRRRIREAEDDMAHWKSLGYDIESNKSDIRHLRDNLRELKPPPDDPIPHGRWADLLNFNVSFDIPFKTRFEHSYVLGATGTGKTQLLQFLIARRVHQGSVIVIDSQGDLIRNIQNCADIDPERYVIIDPSDIEYPVALNIFDIGQERIAKLSKLEYERHINGVIELLAYVFSSILGAELTQRQGVALNFCLRLCLFIPNATIHTLRDIFAPNGLAPYAKYLTNLTESGQAFFKNEFDNPKAFGDVKSQVLRRLYGILENPTIERLFTHPKSKFDMKQAMDDGKVVLINTAKDLLKQQGCSFFGRFFISLIAQATQERASQRERKPVYVFIDEAQDYLDTNIATLLEQSRKYNVSLTLAHQQLGQLPSEIQASILTNTASKFIGGCSSSDARTLSSDMRAEPEMLMNQPKLSFTTYIKGFTQKAISLPIRAGYLESLPQRNEKELHDLIASNRERVSSPPLVRPPQSTDDDPGTSPAKW